MPVAGAESVTQAQPFGPLLRQEVSGDWAARVSGGSAPSSAFEPATLVYGVPIDSVRNLIITREARCVIVLAAAAATMSVVHFIASLLRDPYMDGDSIMTRPEAFMELLFDLAVPACGYHGARSGSQQLMCCFCSYNFVIALTTSLSMARLAIRVEELDRECARETNMQSRRSCETWVHGGVGWIFMMSGSICQILLGLLAFWFGYRHYQRLTRHDVTVVVPELLVSQVAPRIPGVVVGIVMSGGVPSSILPAPTNADRHDRGGAATREAFLSASESTRSPAPATTATSSGYPAAGRGRPPEAPAADGGASFELVSASTSASRSEQAPRQSGPEREYVTVQYLPPVVVQASPL